MLLIFSECHFWSIINKITLGYHFKQLGVTSIAIHIYSVYPDSGFFETVAKHLEKYYDTKDLSVIYRRVRRDLGKRVSIPFSVLSFSLTFSRTRKQTQLCHVSKWGKIANILDGSLTTLNNKFLNWPFSYYWVNVKDVMDSIFYLPLMSVRPLFVYCLNNRLPPLPPQKNQKAKAIGLGQNTDTSMNGWYLQKDISISGRISYLERLKCQSLLRHLFHIDAQERGTYRLNDYYRVKSFASFIDR